jgi:hypothetical protein
MKSFDEILNEAIIIKKASKKELATEIANMMYPNGQFPAMLFRNITKDDRETVLKQFNRMKKERKKSGLNYSNKEYV